MHHMCLFHSSFRGESWCYYCFFDEFSELRLDMQAPICPQSWNILSECNQFLSVGLSLLCSFAFLSSKKAAEFKLILVQCSPAIWVSHFQLWPTKRTPMNALFHLNFWVEFFSYTLYATEFSCCVKFGDGRRVSLGRWFVVAVRFMMFCSRSDFHSSVSDRPAQRSIFCWLL